MHNLPPSDSSKCFWQCQVFLPSLPFRNTGRGCVSFGMQGGKSTTGLLWAEEWCSKVSQDVHTSGRLVWPDDVNTEFAVRPVPVGNPRLCKSWDAGNQRQQCELSDTHRTEEGEESYSPHRDWQIGSFSNFHPPSAWKPTEEPGGGGGSAQWMLSKSCLRQELLCPYWEQSVCEPCLFFLKGLPSKSKVL